MTTVLDQMTATQFSKYATFNDNIGSLSPAGFLGRRPKNITGLTWAFFGGTIWANGGWRTIANNTISCTGSQTNYIALDLEGDGTDPAITIGTTGFVDGEIPIAEVVCDATDITSEIDRRRGIEFDRQGRDEQVIAYSATIAPDVLAGILVVVGALTGDITIDPPTNPFLGAQLVFLFEQDGTGSRIITWDSIFVKVADEGGAASDKGATSFIYDGTDWVQVNGGLRFEGADVQTIAASATITADALLGHVVNVGAITEATTVAAPANPYTGAELDFMFLQDGTGGFTLTWDSIFKKASDPADGTANQVMATSFVYNGTNWIQKVGAFAWFS